SMPAGAPPKDAFLRQEALPEGAALGLSAIREVEIGDKSLWVIGGRRLDEEFMASLELPAGMRAMLYRNLAKGFSPQLLVAPPGSVREPKKLAALIEKVQEQPEEATAVLH